MSPALPEGRWPVARLALVLYPFVALATAVNLFFLGLMGRAVGMPEVAPGMALWLGLALGVPLTVLAGRWVRGMMDEADRDADD
ncbi:MAG: hypothetical protein ACOCYE_09610 [Pseudomonadota bacterium]